MNKSGSCEGQCWYARARPNLLKWVQNESKTCRKTCGRMEIDEGAGCGSTINSLTCLRNLSLDPALFFSMCFVYLPDVAIFHWVTHLDLTITWTCEAIAMDFHQLSCLTHLSMSWCSSYTSTDSLCKLLNHMKFELIVLWRDGHEIHNVIINSLLKWRLDDPQIVVLCHTEKSFLMSSRGFWQHDDHIVAWCKKNNSKYCYVCAKIKLTL